jgi:hemolysin D
MQIVPLQSQVEVEAYLENKDVGFVQEGQSVAVKIDAFEYTKYGTIPAHVTHVSRDAVSGDKQTDLAQQASSDGGRKSGLLYAVKIMLDQPTIFVDGKVMPITAGMSVSAEIKTGTRRVIEYVLSPLVQHAHEALNER